MKNIELDFKDDHIKLQIREDSITAPQYLINKIKQLIQSMIFQTTSLIFQYLENALIYSDKVLQQLNTTAKNFNCEIDKIDIETNKEAILLPKRQNTSTSKYIIKQSEQFYSSLSIPKKLLISNHSIEIHKSCDLPVSLMIQF